MCEKYINLNDRFRVTYDNRNWILEKARKKKKSDELAWSQIGYFGRLTHLFDYYTDQKLRDTFDDVTNLCNVYKDIVKDINKCYEIIIKDELPTIFKEKVIIERRIEVMKEDKRTKSGLNHIENKIETEVIKDDTKDSNDEFNFV